MIKLNISFDYELSWGILNQSMDRFISKKFEKRILDGNCLVPKILEILKDADLVSTWGIVAATTHESWDHLFSYQKSFYTDVQLDELKNKYSHLKSKYTENYFFDPKITRIIIENNRVELSSHGGLHIYYSDPSLNRQDVYSDLKYSFMRLNEISSNFSRTIILPRNQIGHSEIMEKVGFEKMRPSPFFTNNLYYGSTSLLAKYYRFKSDISEFSSFPGDDILVFLRLDWSNLFFEIQLKNLSSFLKNNVIIDKSVFIYLHPHNIFNNNTLINFMKFVDVIKSLELSNVIKMRNLSDEI